MNFFFLEKNKRNVVENEWGTVSFNEHGELYMSSVRAVGILFYPFPLLLDRDTATGPYNIQGRENWCVTTPSPNRCPPA